MKIRYLILIAFTVTGCVNPPTQQEIASADYGVFPTNSGELIKDFYSNRLKDPDSVKYKRFTQPKQYYLGDRSSGPIYGYLVCATLNAKNSYGAYIGYSTDGFLIRNGHIVKYVQDGLWGTLNVCQ